MHARVAEALLDLFDGLVKLDLGIGRAEVPDAFWVHKNHILLTA